MNDREAEAGPVSVQLCSSSAVSPLDSPPAGPEVGSSFAPVAKKRGRKPKARDGQERSVIPPSTVSDSVQKPKRTPVVPGQIAKRPAVLKTQKAAPAKRIKTLKELEETLPPAQLQAWLHVDKNPSGYYFKYKDPHEPPRKTGAWLAEEREIFMRRLAEAEQNGDWDGDWGELSRGVSGRTGKQCLSYYRKLVDSGVLPMTEAFYYGDHSEPGMPSVGRSGEPEVPPVVVYFDKCPPGPLELCVLCGGHGDPKTLLFCIDCGECYHAFCLHPPLSVPPRRAATWRCQTCKCCERCLSQADEDQLLVCDTCDGGWHTFCLDPPLEDIPDGSWNCVHCMVCRLCGSNRPGPGPGDVWQLDVGMCQPCGELYKKGNFCPVCDGVYRGDETDPDMLQCDECDRWVHTDCDSMDQDVYERFGQDGTPYACPSCRAGIPPPPPPPRQLEDGTAEMHVDAPPLVPVRSPSAAPTSNATPSPSLPSSVPPRLPPRPRGRPPRAVVASTPPTLADVDPIVAAATAAVMAAQKIKAERRDVTPAAARGASQDAAGPPVAPLANGHVAHRHQRPHKKPKKFDLFETADDWDPSAAERPRTESSQGQQSVYGVQGAAVGNGGNRGNRAANAANGGRGVNGVGNSLGVNGGNGVMDGNGVKRAQRALGDSGSQLDVVDGQRHPSKHQANGVLPPTPPTPFSSGPDSGSTMSPREVIESMLRGRPDKWQLAHLQIPTSNEPGAFSGLGHHLPPSSSTHQHPTPSTKWPRPGVIGTPASPSKTLHTIRTSPSKAMLPPRPPPPDAVSSMSARNFHVPAAPMTAGLRLEHLPHVENLYRREQYPSPAEMETVALACGLDYVSVRSWFHLRRANDPVAIRDLASTLRITTQEAAKILANNAYQNTQLNGSTHAPPDASLPPGPAAPFSMFAHPPVPPLHAAATQPPPHPMQLFPHETRQTPPPPAMQQMQNSQQSQYMQQMQRQPGWPSFPPAAATAAVGGGGALSGSPFSLVPPQRSPTGSTGPLGLAPPGRTSPTTDAWSPRTPSPMGALMAPTLPLGTSLLPQYPALAHGFAQTAATGQAARSSVAAPAQPAMAVGTAASPSPMGRGTAGAATSSSPKPSTAPVMSPTSSGPRLGDSSGAAIDLMPLSAASAPAPPTTVVPAAPTPLPVAVPTRPASVPSAPAPVPTAAVRTPSPSGPTATATAIAAVPAVALSVPSLATSNAAAATRAASSEDGVTKQEQERKPPVPTTTETAASSVPSVGPSVRTDASSDAVTQREQAPAPANETPPVAAVAPGPVVALTDSAPDAAAADAVPPMPATVVSSTAAEQARETTRPATPAAALPDVVSQPALASPRKSPRSAKLPAPAPEPALPAVRPSTPTKASAAPAPGPVAPPAAARMEPRPRRVSAAISAAISRALVEAPKRAAKSPAGKAPAEAAAAQDASPKASDKTGADDAGAKRKAGGKGRKDTGAESAAATGVKQSAAGAEAPSKTSGKGLGKKELSKPSAKEAAKTSAKDSAKDPAKASAKEASKVSAKETAKASAKEAAKGSSEKAAGDVLTAIAVLMSSETERIGRIRWAESVIDNEKGSKQEERRRRRQVLAAAAAGLSNGPSPPEPQPIHEEPPALHVPRHLTLAPAKPLLRRPGRYDDVVPDAAAVKPPEPLDDDEDKEDASAGESEQTSEQVVVTDGAAGTVSAPAPPDVSEGSTPTKAHEIAGRKKPSPRGRKPSSPRLSPEFQKAVARLETYEEREREKMSLRSARRQLSTSSDSAVSDASEVGRVSAPNAPTAADVDRPAPSASDERVPAAPLPAVAPSAEAPPATERTLRSNRRSLVAAGPDPANRPASPAVAPAPEATGVAAMPTLSTAGDGPRSDANGRPRTSTAAISATTSSADAADRGPTVESGPAALRTYHRRKATSRTAANAAPDSPSDAAKPSTPVASASASASESSDAGQAVPLVASAPVSSALSAAAGSAADVGAAGSPRGKRSPRAPPAAAAAAVASVTPALADASPPPTGTAAALPSVSSPQPDSPAASPAALPFAVNLYVCRCSVSFADNRQLRTHWRFHCTLNENGAKGGETKPIGSPTLAAVSSPLPAPSTAQAGVPAASATSQGRGRKRKDAEGEVVTLTVPSPLAATMADNVGPVPAKRRGRKPKNHPASSAAPQASPSVAAPSAEAPDLTVASAADPSLSLVPPAIVDNPMVVVKKRRGRPPKSAMGAAAAAAKATKPVVLGPDGQPIKRKRGRKRKIPDSESPAAVAAPGGAGGSDAAQAADATAVPTKKKRGPKPKAPSLVDQILRAKGIGLGKRGRKPKGWVPPAAHHPASKVEAAPPPVQHLFKRGGPFTLRRKAKTLPEPEAAAPEQEAKPTDAAAAADAPAVPLAAEPSAAPLAALEQSQAQPKEAEAASATKRSKRSTAGKRMASAVASVSLDDWTPLTETQRKKIRLGVSPEQFRKVVSEKPTPVLPDDFARPADESPVEDILRPRLETVDSDKRVCGICRKEGDSPSTQGGRLLPVDVDVWVHANCALWSSEVYMYADGGLVNLAKAINRGRKVVCTECNEYGATSGCTFAKCQRSYHLACARKAKCLFGETWTDGWRDAFVYCKQHADEADEETRRNPLPSAKLLETRIRLYKIQGVPDSDTPLTGRAAAAAEKKAKQLLGSSRMRSGSLTIEALGKIVSNVAKFHCETAIFPSGYDARRRFWSYAAQQPLTRCEYRCRVVASQDGSPLFSIVADDDPAGALQAESAVDCWRAVIDRVNYRRRSQGLPLVQLSRGGSVLASAFHFFGFIESWVINLIEEMPEAVHCVNYRSPRSAGMRELLRLAEAGVSNPTGCARTEPYVGSKRKGPKRQIRRTGADSLPLSLVRAPVKTPIISDFRSSLPDAMRYRQFKANRPPVMIGRSRIHEWGVFATTPFHRGDMVIEYVGEVIRDVISDLREKMYERKRIGCYMFRLKEDQVIDATMKGNKARYVNHSCDPNAYTRAIVVEGVSKMMIFAKRDIAPGEEITYDYSFALEDTKIPCHCGASNCRKYMN